MSLPEPYSYIIPVATVNSVASAGEDAQQGELEEAERGFVKLILSNDIDPEEKELFDNTLWTMTASSSGGGEGEIELGEVGASVGDSKADASLRSRLVLIDDLSGRVVGQLPSSGVQEDSALASPEPGHEDEPVVVDAQSGPAGLVTVQPVSSWKPTPNPTGSKIIEWGDWVSSGIVYGAEQAAKGLEYGSNRFTSSTKPLDTPLVFSPRTHANVQTGHNFTAGAVKVSGKTVEIIGGLASKLGDRVGKAVGIQSTPGGAPPTGARGLVNRSLVAFNSVLDGLESGGKTLLAAGGSSATTVVGHRYGSEAAAVSEKVGGSVKHVSLVYIDARGVTRKALLKSVGKSAIRAKMSDGREVMLTEEGKGEGTFLLFVATALFTVATVSSPFISGLAFLTVGTTSSASSSGQATLGTFGYCIKAANTTCSPKTLGYSISTAITDGTAVAYYDVAIDNATKGLILNPIAAGVTFFSFAISFLSHKIGYIFATLVGIVAFVASLAALGLDLYIFMNVKNSIGPEASLGIAMWLVVAGSAVVLNSPSTPSVVSLSTASPPARPNLVKSTFNHTKGPMVCSVGSTANATSTFSDTRSFHSRAILLGSSCVKSVDVVPSAIFCVLFFGASAGIAIKWRRRGVVDAYAVLLVMACSMFSTCLGFAVRAGLNSASADSPPKSAVIAEQIDSHVTLSRDLVKATTYTRPTKWTFFNHIFLLISYILCLFSYLGLPDPANSLPSSTKRPN
ncbi:hypothetical protein MNV49_002052 [Pseudohyphozyma bogoriensis]|nr:hypothetical protein MNV49_002052 [Pseudohyphozyma bogoriensis]